MLKLRNKRRWAKGEMSRTIVIYCLRLLTLVMIWAACLKTYAVIRWGETTGCDLSDVLIFAATAFGGELLLLAFKRVFAKKNENSDDYN